MHPASPFVGGNRTIKMVTTLTSTVAETGKPEARVRSGRGESRITQTFEWESQGF
jgi:hypothetical protein